MKTDWISGKEDMEKVIAYIGTIIIMVAVITWGIIAIIL